MGCRPARGLLLRQRQPRPSSCSALRRSRGCIPTITAHTAIPGRPWVWRFQYWKAATPLLRKYIACDVVPGLISRNQEKFSDADVDFRCLDITQRDFPDAEVALLRQVLQHLSTVQILQVVPSLYRYRFLVVSEHLPVEPDFRPNVEKPAGAMIRLFLGSGVILTEPPFNLKVKSARVICSVSQAVDDHPGLVRTTLYEL